VITAVHGPIRRIGLDHVIIGAGPLDVKVAMPLTSLRGLPAVGATVTVHTHLYVREDNLSLFGFTAEDDLMLFELLLTVTGIGPRMALALLSTWPGAELATKIASGDEAALARAPGVGRRTAARLVLELKERVARLGPLGGGPHQAVDDDLVEVLVGWGYRRPEAERVLGLPEIAAVPDAGARLAAATVRLSKAE
jgi:Holliday junction DNA helicase RuvA